MVKYELEDLAIVSENYKIIYEKYLVIKGTLKQHSYDGPSSIDHSGSKFYYQEGKLHRENGPAIESPLGSCLYFLNGVYLSEVDYFKAIGKEYLLNFK